MYTHKKIGQSKRVLMKSKRCGEFSLISDFLWVYELLNELNTYLTKRRKQKVRLKLGCGHLSTCRKAARWVIYEATNIFVVLIFVSYRGKVKQLKSVYADNVFNSRHTICHVTCQAYLKNLSLKLSPRRYVDKFHSVFIPRLCRSRLNWVWLKQKENVSDQVSC